MSTYRFKPVHAARVFAILILLIPNCLSAQTWKWGLRHGGDSIQTSILWSSLKPWHDRFQGWNNVVDIATDPQNNSYVVSNVLSNYLDINGSPIPAYGKSDILLCSYTCDGVLRWTKVIGSNQDSDIVIGVRCDESGVYVSGMTSTNFASGSTGTHFSTDTVTGSSASSIFLVKWDLSGNFQWLRMPQPLTISAQDVRGSMLMDMDATSSCDTLMLFCYLTAGPYVNGAFTAPATGVYVLKYTRTGSFAGATGLPFQQLPSLAPIKLGMPLTRWCYNEPLRQYVAAGAVFPGGTSTVNISGHVLRNSYAYLANFSASSGTLNYILKDTSTSILSRTLCITRKVAIDRKGDIYLSGNSKIRAYFNGVSFYNAIVTPGKEAAPAEGYAPFIMKLAGATGSEIWTTSSQATSAIGLNICLRKKELLVTGEYQGTLRFSTASISNNYLLDSGDAFMALLDTATGLVRTLSSLRAKGELPLIFNTIVLDRKGSFLSGGGFNDTLKLRATTLVETHPSNASTPGVKKISDAWIGKFGYDNCNCNVSAGYRTYTPYGTTVFVSYTGNPALDSLVWEWGDGTRSKFVNNYTATISHTYPTRGQYQICVSAYNDTCNDSRFCGMMPVSASSTLPLSVKVYPIPASNELHIDGLSGGSARILSITGQVLEDIQIRDAQQAIPLKPFPPGVYILMLRDNTGRTDQRQFLKE